MAKIIVLLTLKPGKNPEDYEAWARSTDLPTVNALQSIESFTVHAATGLLRGGKAPYDYIEVIDVRDMALFGEETQTEQMKRVAAEFRDWADPVFIMTRPVGDAA